MTRVSIVIPVIAAASTGLAGGFLLRPALDRVLRRRPSLRSFRRELTGPRPGLAFYVIPPGLGDTDEIVAELTAGRRPRLCLIGRLCGPLPYDEGVVHDNVLQRGALWVARGLLMFDPRGDAEMSVLEAPYGVDAREPMRTEAGRQVLTLDLGDGVLVFEPAPDTDLEHAWSRIRSVLEETTP
ncbi:hypothetical protein GCM10009546_66940 [Actinomadura livida]|uniref:Uncharacterized protein n=1 Tax=Actinomadura livida TaxID=79909 RepID=A0ABN1FQ51_9ACTN|nr:hypothetical protein GCM10010208_40270 [Actinomadura livida]